MISFTGSDYQVSIFDNNAFRGAAEGAAFVQTLSHPLIYAAKFVCGVFKPQYGQNKEGPVEPGSYTTVINVHNPGYCPVTIVKKAVLLYPDPHEQRPETPRPPYQTRTVTLRPDWGVEIDCFDIRTVLLRGPSDDYPKAPMFIEGWVVFESPDPIDVVAVYTARGLDGESSVSIQTDRVIPTRLP
jgi:hypothetical protein